MATSKSDKQLLGDKLKDPYYAIIWCNNIYSIIEGENKWENPNSVPSGMSWNEFLASDLHKENSRLYGEYLESNMSKYKSIYKSVFKMVEISTGQEVDDILSKLEIEFDNGWSVGETEIEPELVTIQNTTWDEVESKYKNGEIEGNWNDVAYLLCTDREVEYLRARYTIEFLDTSLLEEYLSKNMDYSLPSNKV